MPGSERSCHVCYVARIELPRNEGVYELTYVIDTKTLLGNAMSLSRNKLQ